MLGHIQQNIELPLKIRFAHHVQVQQVVCKERGRKHLKEQMEHKVLGVLAYILKYEGSLVIQGPQ